MLCLNEVTSWFKWKRKLQTLKFANILYSYRFNGDCRENMFFVGIVWLCAYFHYFCLSLNVCCVYCVPIIFEYISPETEKKQSIVFNWTNVVCFVHLLIHKCRWSSLILTSHLNHIIYIICNVVVVVFVFLFPFFCWV